MSSLRARYTALPTSPDDEDEQALELEYNDTVSIGWRKRCLITSDQATKLREAIQSM